MRPPPRATAEMYKVQIATLHRLVAPQIITPFSSYIIRAPLSCTSTVPACLSFFKVRPPVIVSAQADFHTRKVLKLIRFSLATHHT